MEGAGFKQSNRSVYRGILSIMYVSDKGVNYGLHIDEDNQTITFSEVTFYDSDGMVYEMKDLDLGKFLRWLKVTLMEYKLKKDKK